jgi:light-regulated signal transduction histidine kinase (bacteriophytochrome)
MGVNPGLKSLFKSPRDAADWDDYCRLLTDEIYAVSGFERVMVYRFLADGSGEVIAERQAPGMEPYLGLRYPASDIPRIARELYRRDTHRQIPDINAAPVPVLAVDGAEADLGLADLRAVSPVHVQYLKNMGVRASLSFSVVINDALWGLIACHHRTPRRLPLLLRERCVDMVEVFALGIAGHLANRRLAAIGVIDKAIEGVVSALHLAQHEDDGSALGPALLGLCGAGGAALWERGELTCFGSVPSPSALQALIRWLHAEAKESIFATAALSEHYPPAASFTTAASGLLAVRVAEHITDLGHERTFLWFRPEMPQTVHWAGDPRKSVVTLAGGPVDDGGGAAGDGGPVMLSPRSSFALWIETTTGRSAPWSDADLLAAKKFRNLILRGLEPRYLRP